MNNNMLPPSASGFMRSTETVTERLTDIPVDLRKLWNPDECPADLLPYLAWALSVDRWDKNWSEQTKRQVIKASWLVHRQKGTISALRRVVEPFGFLLRVIEWWQSGEEPGTFKLEIGIQEQGITEETYLELERLIDDENNKGILLYINSPGGGTYESDEMYLELKKYKEKTGRPIYAYYAQTAASGALYISMAADEIYANRMTMTGSIGVIMQNYDASGLMEKLGIKSDNIVSGRNKGMGGYDGLTDEQKQILQSMVN